MEITLKNRHAVVCGSTQGIGYSIAMEFAKLGANVTLLARDQNKLINTLSELPRVAGQNHESICSDFTKPDDLRIKVQRYLETRPKVEILVNNTGGPPPGTTLESTSEQFLQAFSSHLLCNQILVQSFVPGMKDAHYGRIINIVSTSVREPIVGLGVSNTVRAAVAGWAKTLSKELGPHEITVNNILPGATRTQRLQNIFEQKAKNKGTSIKEIEEAMLKEIPMGRFAQPVEIAGLACFLASPAASYISGVSIPVDGGRMACL